MYRSIYIICMYTKKKHPKIHKKRKNKNTRKIGGKSTSFQNFQNVGKTIDKFLQNFNIDEISKMNASEYLGYKTYNRNNIFKFTTFTFYVSTIIEKKSFSAIKENNPCVI